MNREIIRECLERCEQRNLRRMRHFRDMTKLKRTAKFAELRSRRVIEKNLDDERFDLLDEQDDFGIIKE